MSKALPLHFGSFAKLWKSVLERVVDTADSFDAKIAISSEACWTNPTAAEGSTIAAPAAFDAFDIP
jgi:hypothetical protein